MTTASLFDGIYGFGLAAERAGMRVAWTSEIERFPLKVRQARRPGIPEHGDIRAIDPARVERVDVLTGGFPCQDLSVAGKRAGLAGERSGLFWEIVRLAGVLRPDWVVLENVPGLLSSNGGRDFRTVLGALADLGYLGCWRVLDAQFFGVAQRRRRVFVVGCAGRERLAALLPFLESGSRHPAPRQEAGTATPSLLGSGAGTSRPSGLPAESGLLVEQSRAGFSESGQGWWRDGIGSIRREGCWKPTALAVAPTLDASFGRLQGCSGQDANHGHGHLVPFSTEETSKALSSGGGRGIGRYDPNGESYVVAGDSKATTNRLPAGRVGGGEWSIAHALRAEGFDASEDGTGRGTPLILQEAQTGCRLYPTAGSLRADAPGTQPTGSLLAFGISNDPTPKIGHGVMPTCQSKTGGGGFSESVCTGMTVRRLTPTECERLQGFPDGWTCLCGRNQGRSWPAEDACTCPDGSRYRALGNAVAVPVAAWMLAQIAAAESRAAA